MGVASWWCWSGDFCSVENSTEDEKESYEEVEVAEELGENAVDAEGDDDEEEHGKTRKEISEGGKSSFHE